MAALRGTQHVCAGVPRDADVELVTDVTERPILGGLSYSPAFDAILASDKNARGG